MSVSLRLEEVRADQWARRTVLYSRARRLRAKNKSCEQSFDPTNNPQAPVDLRVTEVEPIGLEPTTSCMPCKRSPN